MILIEKFARKLKGEHMKKNSKSNFYKRMKEAKQKKRIERKLSDTDTKHRIGLSGDMPDSMRYPMSRR